MVMVIKMVTMIRAETVMAIRMAAAATRKPR